MPFFVTAVALALFVGASLRAEDQPGDKGETHEGTVVSMTGDKLIMKGKAKDGQEAIEHTHKLASNARVMCDGKECKLEDLSPARKSGSPPRRAIKRPPSRSRP